jgi:hypothetical protein
MKFQREAETHSSLVRGAWPREAFFIEEEYGAWRGAPGSILFFCYLDKLAHPETGKINTN